MDRRLVAILAADAVGYSRRMGEDEVTTLEALRECRGHLVRLIDQHGGQVINTAGDSVLAHLPSVVSAVECAVAFQRFIEHRDVGQSADGRMEFRVGVNQGELVVDEDDVYGDGINVAVRLERSARPGGVAVSGRVYEDVAGKVDLRWEDGGECRLKNIVRPIRVWHWSGCGPQQDARFTSPVPERPSIAVLPFANLGGETSDTTFSDGITEDIINGLARFRSLFVVARSSSFVFRNTTAPPTEVGRRLGVAYLLEGSVRRSAERIRVNAQLVEAGAGATVWAERFDRKLTDIFEVQDDIAMTIVGTLAGRIEDTETTLSMRKPPSSLAAYDLLLRGISSFRAYGETSNRNAADLFEQAIKLEPSYGQAYCYLALSMLALNGYGAAPKDVRLEVCGLARHGVELNPQDGSCQRLLGNVLLYDREYDLAEYHLRRAIELNPNDADGTILMGHLLVQRGRATEGFSWMEKAVRLNPFHPPWYHELIAAALYSLGRYEESVQSSHRIPAIGSPSFRLAAAYAQLGREKEAAEQAAAILKADPDFQVDAFMVRAALLEREEDRELLREGLLKAGLPR